MARRIRDIAIDWETKAMRTHIVQTNLVPRPLQRPGTMQARLASNPRSYREMREHAKEKFSKALAFLAK